MVTIVQVLNARDVLHQTMTRIDHVHDQEVALDHGQDLEVNRAVAVVQVQGQDPDQGQSQNHVQGASLAVVQEAFLSPDHDLEVENHEASRQVVVDLDQALEVARRLQFHGNQFLAAMVVPRIEHKFIFAYITLMIISL